MCLPGGARDPADQRNFQVCRLYFHQLGIVRCKAKKWAQAKWISQKETAWKTLGLPLPPPHQKGRLELGSADGSGMWRQDLLYHLSMRDPSPRGPFHWLG